MKIKSDQTYSISQVSEMTSVSKNRIREWHGKGYLSDVKWISVGSRPHRRFSEEDIRTILEILKRLEKGFVLKVSAMKVTEKLMKKE